MTPGLGDESICSYYTSRLSCAFKQRKGPFLMKEILGLAVLRDDVDDELVSSCRNTSLVLRLTPDLSLSTDSETAVVQHREVIYIYKWIVVNVRTVYLSIGPHGPLHSKILFNPRATFWTFLSFSVLFL